MSSLTDGAEDRALNWLTMNTTTAPTTALQVRLMSANGSDSAAGTEVSGNPRQTVTFSASSAGATSNPGALNFTSMPATTVVGIEIWDTGGPFRWWWGPLAANKTTNSGDTFTIAIGDLDLTMS